MNRRTREALHFGLSLLIAGAVATGYLLGVRGVPVAGPARVVAVELSGAGPECDGLPVRLTGAAGATLAFTAGSTNRWQVTVNEPESRRRLRLSPLRWETRTRLDAQTIAEAVSRAVAQRHPGARCERVEWEPLHTNPF
jgi:hypothetical protein